MAAPYANVPKIILIIRLEMDSDGKWTILVQEALKCAVIIASAKFSTFFLHEKKTKRKCLHGLFGLRFDKELS